MVDIALCYWDALQKHYSPFCLTCDCQVCGGHQRRSLVSWSVKEPGAECLTCLLLLIHPQNWYSCCFLLESFALVPAVVWILTKMLPNCNTIHCHYDQVGLPLKWCLFHSYEGESITFSIGGKQFDSYSLQAYEFVLIGNMWATFMRSIWIMSTRKIKKNKLL